MISAAATKYNGIHVSDISFQPIAANDVTSLVAELALSDPANRIVDIAGPDLGTMNAFASEYEKQVNERHDVIVNQNSEYFGAKIPLNALVPQGDAKLGSITFQEWLLSPPKGS